MKATFDIEARILAKLRREAYGQGRNMSEIVETELRRLFCYQRRPKKIRALPAFDSGGTFVDLADRDALYRAMERQ